MNYCVGTSSVACLLFFWQLTQQQPCPFALHALPHQCNMHARRYKCKTPEPHAASGRFRLRAVQGLVEAQQHIRQWGGVATSLDIYEDFHDFFKANPSGVYEGHQCKEANAATFQEGHAIVLVGYNNAEQYWIARSSW